MKFETKIKEIIPRTADVTSYRFPRPEELTYKAGQYFFITIKQDEKELTHHFSFSSSPTEKDFFEFTKKFTDHEFSTALKATKVGDWARIDAPFGKFTFEGEYPKIAMLAGGIGITPFFSIIKNTTDRRLSTQITLFYGCRSESDIAFRNELESLERENKNLKLVFIVNQPSFQWKGETGVITAEIIRKYLPDYKNNMFYACGPPPMVVAIEKLFAGMGIQKEDLKLEYFTGYT